MPAPAPASAPAPPRWNVFLSSTVRDLRAWRRGVKEALDLAEVQCYPSEDWVNTWQDTEAACKQRFDECDSYMLLLGYWYGSELPGRARTVTQVEFDWASKRKWKCSPVPMAVLMPDDDSPAKTKLRNAARRLARKLPDDAARQHHDERVQKWHDAVCGSWKTVDKFTDVANLRERVIVIVRRWDPAALIAKARGAGTVDAHGPRLGPVDLGLLCRGAQFRATRLLRADAKHAGAPALALLAHGGRDAGGEYFVQRLAVKELKCGGNGIGSVPGHATPALLAAKIASLLGLDVGADPTPAALATLAAAELKTQSLAFVLEDCATYPGGVGAIESDFWQPFEAALRAVQAAQPLAHSLTAVFADFSGDAEDWLGKRGAVGGDRRDRLQPLPVLGDFDADQLYEGFETLKIASRQWQALADHALHTAGKPDPVAVRALARLANKPIDYEEEDEP